MDTCAWLHCSKSHFGGDWEKGAGQGREGGVGEGGVVGEGGGGGR